jgi:hypothetical protein
MATTVDIGVIKSERENEHKEKNGEPQDEEKNGIDVAGEGRGRFGQP